MGTSGYILHCLTPVDSILEETAVKVAPVTDSSKLSKCTPAR